MYERVSKKYLLKVQGLVKQICRNYSLKRLFKDSSFHVVGASNKTGQFLVLMIIILKLLVKVCCKLEGLVLWLFNTATIFYIYHDFVGIIHERPCIEISFVSDN